MFLSFTWSKRTPAKFSFFSHFLVYHRERAREIVGLLAAPSVLETGNISSQWLSFLPSQILIELELSQEVNSWQGLPVASKLLRYGFWMLLPLLLLKAMQRLSLNISSAESKTISSARIYRPSFHENKPKTLISLNRKRGFWLVFAKTGSIISGTELKIFPNKPNRPGRVTLLPRMDFHKSK